MPLPDGGNTPWPPEELEPVFDKLATWSAWYTGDADELSGVYGGQPDRTGFFASESGGIRGGIRGAVRSAFERMFWGTAPSPGEQRTKLHVPIASDIASMSGDLLFAEPPRLTAEDTATTDVLATYTDEETHATLREAAEIGSALGGAYLRVVWNREVSDRPWLDTVHADAGVPEWTYGRLSAVTFFRCLDDDGTTVVRHLERHERGRILHGVYVGDRDTLGVRVPLTEYPETQGFAAALNDGDEIVTGIDMLTAGYVPNLRPNKIWRDYAAAGHLGRSDFSGVEALMDALDERYSDWMREVRLAKARLTVPRSFLESMGRGQGAFFDADKELIVAMDMGPAADGSALQLFQPAIRVTEHMDTVTDLITQILRGSGYSEQSFGMAGDIAVTATEVNARERRSMMTRRRKVTYWTPVLAQILEALLAIDRVVFDADVVPQRPAVEFADAVAVDTLTIAQSLALLRSAQVASTKTLVTELHPDWDDGQVDEEVALIDAARSVPARPPAHPDGERQPAEPDSAGP